MGDQAADQYPGRVVGRVPDVLPEAAMAVQAGPFELVYDPSVGEDEPWYVNDHTFVRGDIFERRPRALSA